MESTVGERRISFLGEVVETCQRDGRTVATIALKSICLEIDAESRQEVHLGDHVVIEAQIEVRSVRQHFEADHPCKSPAEGPRAGSASR